MLALDIIGLVITVFLVGLRYAHYVLLAAVLGETGRIMAILYMNIQPDAVVAGGIFGRMYLQGIHTQLAVVFIYFGGALTNFFIGMAFGGLEKERFASLFNPFAVIKQPFAVINLRLAILAAAYNGWQYLCR